MSEVAVIGLDLAKRRFNCTRRRPTPRIAMPASGHDQRRIFRPDT